MTSCNWIVLPVFVYYFTLSQVSAGALRQVADSSGIEVSTSADYAPTETEENLSVPTDYTTQDTFTTVSQIGIQADIVHEPETQLLSEKHESDEPVSYLEHTELQKWYLSRDNCNRELRVKHGQTNKIAVTFGSENRTSEGQCQITISGDPNKMLALVVSNIHLSGTRHEILRIVTKLHNVNYTMKKFLGNESHLSLLLPDTQPVYLIFGYNTSDVPVLETSDFSFEVFTYSEEDNFLTPFSPKPVLSLADHVYFTTPNSYYV